MTELMEIGDSGSYFQVEGCSEGESLHSRSLVLLCCGVLINTVFTGAWGRGIFA